MKTIALADRPRSAARGGAAAMAADGTNTCSRARPPRAASPRRAAARPSRALTEWTVMGLRAGGAPRSVHRSGGRTRRRTWPRARGLVGERVRARARHPRGGRHRHNPAASAGATWWRRCARGPASGGGIGSAANSTYWGVLALRAARWPVPARRSPTSAPGDSNGGYGWSPSAAPTPTTPRPPCSRCRRPGAGAEAGRSAHAFGYLASAQTAAHGYGLLPGSAADSQSTSWAIQARHACGLRNRRARAWLLARELPERRLQLPARDDDLAGLRHRPGAAGHPRQWYPIGSAARRRRRPPGRS